MRNFLRDQMEKFKFIVELLLFIFKTDRKKGKV